jgi:hypothetical protein
MIKRWWDLVDKNGFMFLGCDSYKLVFILKFKRFK